MDAIYQHPMECQTLHGSIPAALPMPGHLSEVSSDIAFASWIRRGESAVRRSFPHAAAYITHLASDLTLTRC
jgi:hypothetical protein